MNTGEILRTTGYDVVIIGAGPAGLSAADAAKEAGAEYIITCNEKDYCSSEIPAVNPDDFLKALNEISEKF